MGSRRTRSDRRSKTEPYNANWNKGKDRDLDEVLKEMIEQQQKMEVLKFWGYL